MSTPTAQHRPWPVFLMLLCLTTGLLAAAPLGAAQQPPISTDPRPLSDVDLLQHGTEEWLVFEDAVDDTEFWAVGQTPQEAANGNQERVDILELRAAEDAEWVSFRFKHKGHDLMTWLVHGAALGRYDCGLRWTVEGSSADVWYGLRLSNSVRFGSGSGSEIEAYAFVQEKDEESFSPLHYLAEEPVPFTFRTDEPGLQMLFPKRLLAGTAPDDALRVGDRLVVDRAYCVEAGAGYIFGYEDVVSTETAVSGRGSHTIELSGAIDGMSTSMAEDAADVLSAAPGVPKRFEVVIKNHEDQKRLVNLTFDLIGAGDTGAGDTAGAAGFEDWQVVAPPVVEVRGRNESRASIVVTAPVGVEHATGPLLQVNLRPMGSDDVATLRRSVVATVPIGPDNSVLHFFNDRSESVCGFTSCSPGGGSEPDEEVWTYEGHSFRMAPVESHPQHDREPRATGALHSGYPYDAWVRLDGPLVRDLRFDLDEKVMLTLALSASVARDSKVEALLWDATSGDLVAVGAPQTISVDSTVQEFQIPLRIRDEAEHVPAGHELVLSVETNDDMMGMTILGFESGFTWHTGSSSLELPLLPVAESRLEITDGRAIPTIHLRNGTDAEEFVNPGRSREFQLALVNEGVERDVLDVHPALDGSRWGVEILPGQRFELEPGQRAPFSVLVRAPEDAKEGDNLTVELFAASRNDDKVRTSFTVRALVTHGIEFEDDAYSPPAKDEEVAPLVETEEAPLGSVWAVWIVAAGAAASMRRRRG